ncbi:MAG TPA: methyltransferase domain-containing protein [Candidatus Paceibacterota bacterium]|nr:methyltransferase domain-containing protein [Candidatus Paceibacterota bacterium]
MIPSLLRIEEERILSEQVLNGSVLDLGGERGSHYQRLLGGDHTFYTVNVSKQACPDLLHDLELPLPLNDASYDHALLMNVLEHIFGYHAFLKEACRVVRPGGTLTILVPFLFPYHPSPQDFHRFSATALERELTLVGCTEIKVEALGSGVFAARLLMIDRLLPIPLRYFNYTISRHVVRLLDMSFAALSRASSKRYQRSDYALGYIVTATVARV